MHDPKRKMPYIVLICFLMICIVPLLTGCPQTYRCRLSFDPNDPKPDKDVKYKCEKSGITIKVMAGTLNYPSPWRSFLVMTIRNKSKYEVKYNWKEVQLRFADSLEYPPLWAKEHGIGGRLKQPFIVKPGEARAISLDFQGIKHLEEFQDCEILEYTMGNLVYEDGQLACEIPKIYTFPKRCFHGALKAP